MKTLLVKARFAGSPDSDWVHRFRNFGEEAWRELRDDSDLSIDQIDHCTSSFEVSRLKSRRVGRTKQMLRKLIDAHGFSDDLEIQEHA